MEAEGSWISFGLSAVAAAGAITTSVLAYLSSRDKLRYDAELTKLRDKVQQCLDDVATCSGEREANERRAEEMEKRAVAAEAEVARLEGILKGMEERVADLFKEVKDLRDRLYPSKSSPIVALPEKSPGG